MVLVAEHHEEAAVLHDWDEGEQNAEVEILLKLQT